MTWQLPQVFSPFVNNRTFYLYWFVMQQARRKMLASVRSGYLATFFYCFTSSSFSLDRFIPRLNFVSEDNTSDFSMLNGFYDSRFALVVSL